MYKIIDFLQIIFLHKEIMFLGIFKPSFRKLHRKKFLTIFHVSKMTFLVEISRKSTF